MKCGEFLKNARDRIAIQAPSLTGDVYGGQTNTWTTSTTVYAWIKPINAYEKTSNLQLQSTATHKFIIRYQAALKDTKTVGAYRVLFDSRIYSTTGIINYDETLKNYGTVYQVIQAEENGAEKA